MMLLVLICRIVALFWDEWMQDATKQHLAGASHWVAVHCHKDGKEAISHTKTNEHATDCLHTRGQDSN